MSDLTPKPIKETPFLTVIPDRYRQKQKAHATRGHAHAALSQRVSYFGKSGPDGFESDYRLTSDVALYDWHEGDWRLLWQGSHGDKIDRANPAWKSA